MSLINCPECNEKLSDSVKQCIHCGARIVICPECNKSYVKGVINICSECGYEFKEEKEDSDRQKMHENVPPMHAENFMHENKIRQSKFTFLTFFSILCGGGAVVFMLWGILKFGNWVKQEQTLKFFEYATINLAVIRLFVISAILEVFDKIVDVVEIKKALLSPIEYSKLKKIDLKQVVENTLAQDFSRMKAEIVEDHANALAPVIDSILYENDQASKKRVARNGFALVLCSFVGSLFLVLFAAHIIPLASSWVMFPVEGTTFNSYLFNNIEQWWLLIVALATYVVNKMIVKQAKKTSARQRKEWIEKNFPEYAQKYDTYLTGFYATKKYVKDASDNSTIGGI